MAENLLPGRYAVGKASVDAGGTVVTPQGATWTDNVWVDDLFFLPSQPLVPPQRIESVNDDGEIVLAYPWPGAAAVEEPYEVRFVGIIERSTAQSRKVLEQLGDVKAWYDIIVEDDAARLALESASNPLPAGYRVLVRLDGVIWMKKTSAFGDWIGPVEFKGDTGNKGWSPAFGVVSDGERRVLQLTAWVGGEGAAPAGVGKYVGVAGLVDDIAQAIDVRGEGFQWGGAYNAANAYEKGSVTRQNGSAFIAAQAVPPGEAPSGAYPPVDTPYWAVLAAKGQDGEIDGVTPFWQSRILNDADAAAAREGLGAGDVVGPAGATAKRLAVFGNLTGKLVAEASGLTLAEQGRARADIGADVLGGVRNRLINGDFRVVQRALVTSIAPGGSRLVLDRWWVENLTNQTLAIALVGVQDYLVGKDALNALRMSFATAPTSGTVTIYQKVEDARTLLASLSTFTFELLESTWGAAATFIDQYFGSGGSPTVNAGGFSTPAGAGKKTGTIPLPNVVGKTFGLNHCLIAGVVFTPRATGSHVLTKLSLVKGDATAEDDPFSPRPYQQELALCQRYYETGPYLFVGYQAAGAGYGSNQSFAVPKRVTPSMTNTPSAVTNVITTTLNAPGPLVFGHNATAVAAGVVVHTGVYFADAEL